MSETHIFYHNIGLNKLIIGREYFTLLARNTARYPNYNLLEILNSKEYAGTYEDYYITGFGDQRCGHYIFKKNEEKNRIDDDYFGRRAFCLFRLIPERWIDSTIEKYLINRAKNIINILLSLSSHIRIGKTNIYCTKIILNYCDFPKQTADYIYKFIENIVFRRRLILL